MSSDLIQQHADALGISRDQYMQLAQQNYASAYQSGSGSAESGGGTQTVSSDEATFQNVSRAVKAQKAMGGSSSTGSSSTGTPALPVGAVDPNQNVINTGAYVLNQKAQYPQFGQANTKSGVGPTGTTVTSSVPGKPDASWANMPGLLGGKADVPMTATTTAVQPVAPANAATYQPGTPNATVPQMNFGQMVAHGAIQNEIQRQTQGAGPPGPTDFKVGGRG